jgi:endonuclease/exonuclease/phosphatase family metal-dependent hydrolase
LTAPYNFDDEYRALIDRLKQFEQRSALFNSSFFAEHGKKLDAIIDRIWQQPCPDARPRLNNFLRVAQWNILRGRHLDAIVDLFNNHPLLASADLIALNEVDLGMNRTNNLNIAFELGRRLGMHALFVAEYLELTKGVGSEKNVPGENRESLHGNALLSRYPLKNPRRLRLPSCFDTFPFWEKRYGDRVALIAEVECPTGSLLVAATHLEVRNTPACRARQFRSLLNELESGNHNLPMLIAGDLNTSTFKRGHIGYTALSLLRLFSSEPQAMRRLLGHPEEAEPLFDLATARKFNFAEFNDDLPTCLTPLKLLDEATQLPQFMQRWVDARLARYNHQLEFRLDYLLARSLRAYNDGEIIDNAANVASRRATTIKGLVDNGAQISDHDPIICDVELPIN